MTNSGKQYENALKLFEGIEASNVVRLDAIAYSGGVRAAGFCRPWEYHLQLLNKAHEKFPNKKDVLEIVHTAMTNEKYRPPVSALSPLVSSMERVRTLVAWLKDREIPVNSKTIDILLAVACVHGTPADRDYAMNLMGSLQLKPTLYTFNTLLDRFASDGDVTNALAIIRSMQTSDITPDRSTFNTLLKLCIRTNDLQGFEKVRSCLLFNVNF